MPLKASIFNNAGVSYDCGMCDYFCLRATKFSYPYYLLYSDCKSQKNWSKICHRDFSANFVCLLISSIHLNSQSPGKTNGN